MSTDINIPNQEDCFEILNARHKSWRRRGKKIKKIKQHQWLSTKTKHAPPVEKKNIMRNWMTLWKQIFNLCMTAYAPSKRCSFSYMPNRVFFLLLWKTNLPLKQLYYNKKNKFKIQMVVKVFHYSREKISLYS